MTRSPTLDVRPARSEDVPALTALLNRVIEIGGTTALQVPLTEAEFDDWFVSGPAVIGCHVAVDPRDGAYLGFQVLTRHDGLPPDWGDIGTFTRPEPKVPGVGTALFPATRALALRFGLSAINATIRADNTGGQAYYAKMGFVTYAVSPGVPLLDGTPVDRIARRYDLAPAGEG